MILKKMILKNKKGSMNVNIVVGLLIFIISATIIIIFARDIFNFSKTLGDKITCEKDIAIKDFSKITKYGTFFTPRCPAEIIYIKQKLSSDKNIEETIIKKIDSTLEQCNKTTNLLFSWMLKYYGKSITDANFFGIHGKRCANIYFTQKLNEENIKTALNNKNLKILNEKYFDKLPKSIFDDTKNKELIITINNEGIIWSDITYNIYDFKQFKSNFEKTSSYLIYHG